jgi:ATP-binding cassette subfamily B protein
MVISGFAEVASLGALLPFLAALADPGRLNSYEAVGKVTNWIGIESPEGLSLALAASFCLIALIAGAIRTLVLWASTRLAYAVAGDISNAVYRRTLYQPYSVHVGRNSSEVISGLSVKVGNVPAVLQQMLALISSVLLLLFVAGALLWINPLVATLVGVGFGGTYVLITGLFRSRLRRNSQDIAREKNRLVKVLQEGLGGIRDVLLGHLQEVYCEAYRRTDDTLRKAQISNVFIGGSPRFVMETSGMVLIAGFSFALTQLSGGLAEALPVLGALALGAQRMLPALQQSYSSWVGIAGSEASLADVLILLDQPLPPEELNTPTAPAAICRSIRLEGVRYDYGSLNPVRVIDGVDIEILKGARVGIVGATGSGKSTLVDLMMGLLEPTEGVVYVDDQPLLGVQRRAWQQTIGHVPQNIFLTDATAAENIAFGVPVAEIDLARVQFAARQAQISDYFETIPLGYSTIVGERGVRLSGGQRQRIGIARALYRRSSVLFFDEATSALDGVTEHAVIDAIERLDRQLTVIIVAHRLSTVRACDYVVQIESGKVIAKGSFDELVASSATFRRMTEPTNNLS